MNDLVNSATGGAIASINALKQGLMNVNNNLPVAGGDPILSFRKGDWSYGVENVAVEEGSTWAVNPLNIRHGYIAWLDRGDPPKGESEKLGEVMVPMVQPKPAMASLPALPEGKPCKGWQDQVELQLLCVSGEDTGEDVRFFGTSVGGTRAVSDLLDQIIKRINAGTEEVVPVVELKTDHYNHKHYGKTFIPVFEVVRWVKLDDPALSAIANGTPAQPEQPEQTTAAAQPEQATAAAQPEQATAAAQPETNAETAPAEGVARRRRR